MKEAEASDDVAWYCLKSQTKREHIAAAALTKAFGGAVEVLCPRIRFRKPTRRGVIWWVEPVFPGYLLARFSKVEYLAKVLHTNGVSGIVQFGNDLPEVDRQVVESLKKEFAEEGGEVPTVERRLGIGDEVEMIDGAFRGIGGVILELVPSNERVHVLLEFLGQSRPVEVDVFSLLLRERAD